MRLNMRRHEVEGRRGGDGEKERERRNRPDLSLALISVLAQWTSNSSAGSRRGKDGKSGNRLFVQMKRENQNPRCNPSFQTAIFFSLSFVRPTHRRIRTLCLSLPFSFLLSFIPRIIQPSAHSRRLLHPVCLRKVDASPNPKF